VQAGAASDGFAAALRTVLLPRRRRASREHAMGQEQRGIPRRRFLAGAGAAIAAVSACSGPSAGRDAPVGSAREAVVTPGEDLMQEHGVIERLLLVYEESAGRIERGEALDPAVVTAAAAIVRRFVEDYHERSEEESIFPRLRAAGREDELVATLLRQHQRGRELTDAIARSAAAGGAPVGAAMRAFIRMYRPHAAREDTVVFPAHRALVDDAAYRELGERFEERERRLLGERGFEQVVAEVAGIERSLGIDRLDRYTAT
jgi:hemerythrin-like domain-containing protein